MSPSVLSRLASSHLVLISTPPQPPAPHPPGSAFATSSFDLVLSSFLRRLAVRSYSFLTNVSNSSRPYVLFVLFSRFTQLFFSRDANLFTRLPRLSLCSLFRRHHLGGHDLRWEAVRRDLHQRHSRPAGEGRASPSAADLHNRRLHGHGQMYVYLGLPQKMTQNPVSLRPSSGTNRKKCAIKMFVKGEKHFRCKQAKVIPLRKKKKWAAIKSTAALVSKSKRILKASE